MTVGFPIVNYQSIIPVIIILVSLLQAHWWAILLAILTLSAVMGGIIVLCGRTLDTSDLQWLCVPKYNTSNIMMTAWSERRQLVTDNGKDSLVLSTAKVTSGGFFCFTSRARKQVTGPVFVVNRDVATWLPLPCERIPHECMCCGKTQQTRSKACRHLTARVTTKAVSICFFFSGLGFSNCLDVRPSFHNSRSSLISWLITCGTWDGPFVVTAVSVTVCLWEFAS